GVGKLSVWIPTYFSDKCPEDRSGWRFHVTRITEDAAMTRSKRPDLETVPLADVGDERVKTVMLLIQKDGYSKTAVEATARSVNVSLSRLCHIFSSEVGMSAVQYAKHVKLSKAKELIETTHSSIKEIALTVGYTSPGRFAIDFRR